jgi:hypothetical protein
MNSYSSYESNHKTIDGTIIVTSGGNVGNSNVYDRNQKKCKREGITEFCIHCHAPLVNDSSYIVKIWNNTNFAPLDYQDDYTEIAYMGSGCIRQFLDKEFIKTYAKKMGA